MGGRKEEEKRVREALLDLCRDSTRHRGQCVGKNVKNKHFFLFFLRAEPHFASVPFLHNAFLQTFLQNASISVSGIEQNDLS